MLDNPFKSPSIISFCPGVLGLERGLERVIGDLRVLAYCEIEAFICANLVAGMEAGVLAPAPIWTDVKTFPAEGFHGKIHGIIGGYPCQPFSTAGKRKGQQDPRHLWPHIRQHIATIRPVWCLFENVAGHLSLGFETVYKELAEMGYRVEAGIFTAEEVGAPHRRERLFILAISDTPRQQNWRLQQPRLQTNTRTSSIELANSDSNGYRAGAGRASEASSQNEIEAQREEWHNILRQWMRNVIGNSSEELFQSLAAGVGQGLEGQRPRESGTGQEFTMSSSFSSDLWPARPNEQPYEWEEPRTIEPGLDCTINGYNFREDLLRALGNSVVEQTAELAFRTLLAKQLRNLA